MTKFISSVFKYGILATFIFLFVGLSGDNIQAQNSNETNEFEGEIRMEQQELEEQLKETIQSLNETEELEGME
ncbi:MAG: hypothetical protein MRJ93_13295 [Nitrososphaeraceae archaeon]|nr:hypothetical protein [Nitrososphaeraceae archaeon]